MREHFAMAVMDSKPPIYSCKCGLHCFDPGVLDGHLFQEDARSKLNWTGPLDDDLADGIEDGATLRHPVPEVRWPYGPPSAHEDGCRLFGLNEPLYCDCKASDASDPDYGIGAWPTSISKKP